MSHGSPNWWDPVQHYQLAALEQTAMQQHQRLEQTAMQQHQRLERLCIQRFGELEERVDKVEADLIVAEAARAEANGTVMQLEARMHRLYEESFEQSRLHEKEIEQLPRRLHELEAATRYTPNCRLQELEVNGSASAPVQGPALPTFLYPRTSTGSCGGSCSGSCAASRRSTTAGRRAGTSASATGAAAAGSSASATSADSRISAGLHLDPVDEAAPSVPGPAGVPGQPANSVCSKDSSGRRRRSDHADRK